MTLLLEADEAVLSFRHTASCTALKEDTTILTEIWYLLPAKTRLDPTCLRATMLVRMHPSCFRKRRSAAMVDVLILY